MRRKGWRRKSSSLCPRCRPSSSSCDGSFRCQTSSRSLGPESSSSLYLKGGGGEESQTSEH